MTSVGQRLARMNVMVWGYGSIQAVSLLRNLLVARLLGPAEFGLAALLVLIITFMEAAFDLAFDKLLVQAPDGDDPQLQASAQAMSIARGAVQALLLFVGAPIAVTGLGASGAAEACQWLALVPLINGFIHLDCKRRQRFYDVRGDVGAGLAGEIISICTAIILAWSLHSFVAMLWALIARAAGTVITSHLVAERPYQIRLLASYRARLLHFGAPLMLNGMVIFAGSQVDRLMVATHFGKAELGIYSVAVLCLSAPMTVLARIISTATLPFLAKAAPQSPAFTQRYTLLTLLMAVVALLFALPFMTVGSDIIRLCFGQRYVIAPIVLMLLATGTACRIQRFAPTVGALATARTLDVMMQNIVRAIAIPLVLLAAWLDMGIAGFAAGVAIGEAAALYYGMIAYNRSAELGWSTGLMQTWILWAGLILLAALSLLAGPHQLLLRVLLTVGAGVFLTVRGYRLLIGT